MRWEKGEPGFDKVAGSKLMGYALNGVNAVIGWTLSHVAEELSDAGFGDLKIAGHTVNEIQAAQQENHRRSMAVLKDFRTETDTPGLFSSVSKGSKQFFVDPKEDRPNVSSPRKLSTAVNSFKKDAPR